MKVYGLRIDKTGVEFSDKESRDKAILCFTKGASVTISDMSGPRFKQSEGAFATYERETNEQSTNCSKCNGVFSSETCAQRTVPKKSWDGKFVEGETEEIYLCDACYAKRTKEFEVHEAQQVLATQASS